MHSSNHHSTVHKTPVEIPRIDTGQSFYSSALNDDLSEACICKLSRAW